MKEPERAPQLDRDLVFEFVKVAHGSLDRVQELLIQEPGLVNACWNWGGDDWETALGAAAHTGHKEIAELLLAKGARMDIFAAAMLGKLNVVQSFLADDLTAVHLKGPHGIPLIIHAKAGGHQDMIAFIEYNLKRSESTK